MCQQKFMAECKTVDGEIGQPNAINTVQLKFNSASRITYTILRSHEFDLIFMFHERKFV